jgi:hypothetical protein
MKRRRGEFVVEAPGEVPGESARLKAKDFQVPLDLVG